MAYIGLAKRFFFHKKNFAQLLSHVWLFETPGTAAPKVPLSMGFSRWGYWSGLLFLTPGNLPDPGIEPTSLTWQADSLPLSHLYVPWDGTEKLEQNFWPTHYMSLLFKKKALMQLFYFYYHIFFLLLLAWLCIEANKIHFLTLEIFSLVTVNTKNNFMAYQREVLKNNLPRVSSAVVHSLCGFRS